MAKLKDLGAQDLGEDLLKEMIFYDAAGKWAGEGKTFVRIRQRTPSSSAPIQGTGGEKNSRARLTYKNDEEDKATGTEEIEFEIKNPDRAKIFLEKLGLEMAREQEKKRHTFKLGEVTVDIDTWPSVSAYVEIEGPSEDMIRKAASKLGFDWKQAVFGNSRTVLEKYYNIPIGKLKYFTFGKIG